MHCINILPLLPTNQPTNQLSSAHAELGSQSNQPQSARVTCGSSVKSVFWIWSLRPGCSKVSWDLWIGTIPTSLPRLPNRPTAGKGVERQSTHLSHLTYQVNSARGRTRPRWTRPVGELGPFFLENPVQVLEKPAHSSHSTETSGTEK